MTHSVIEAAEAALGLQLECAGELGLLDRSRRALLISRGERRPTPRTPWVQQTIAATAKLVNDGEALVTGAGRTAFDAALWSCARAGGGAIVALERGEELNDVVRFMSDLTHGRDARATVGRCLFVWPREAAKKNAARQRDLLMAALADRAYAVSVRKSGNMAQILEILSARGCAVEEFQAAQQGAANGRCSLAPSVECGAEPARETAPAVEASRKLAGCERDEDWAWLTHFTREPDGAFIGESRAEYLAWLCGGEPFEVRDALASLRRILREQRIRGCGALMPGGAAMACFTALHPARAFAQRRWRRGLLRWSFTPYGLMIRKTALIKTGARAVTYASRAEIDAADDAARAFMQVSSSEGADWTQEKEWRVAGDVVLNAFSRDDLMALVATDMEAAQIEREFGIAARVM